MKHFYKGSVIYETIHDFDNTDVPFPSLTLCPALKSNNLVNLKLNEISEEFNLQANQLESFFVYGTLKDINASFTEIVRNYSFSYAEGFNIDYSVNAFGKLRNDSNKLM